MSKNGQIIKEVEGFIKKSLSQMLQEDTTWETQVQIGG
jgi:hypothetical protein